MWSPKNYQVLWKCRHHIIVSEPFITHALALALHRHQHECKVVDVANEPTAYGMPAEINAICLLLPLPSLFTQFHCLLILLKTHRSSYAWNIKCAMRQKGKRAQPKKKLQSLESFSIKHNSDLETHSRKIRAHRHTLDCESSVEFCLFSEVEARNAEEEKTLLWYQPTQGMERCVWKRWESIRCETGNSKLLRQGG